MIPKSVETIGGGAFYGCSSLTKIVVDKSNTKYRSSGNCLIDIRSKTLLVGSTAAVIPSDEGVTTIGNSAFYGCSALTKIAIPNNIKNIENYAFEGCSGLTNVTMGNGVVTIGYGAFSKKTFPAVSSHRNGGILIDSCETPPPSFPTVGR